MKLALFPVLFAVGMSSMDQAQSSIDRPKVVIDAVELKGTLLPEAAQERLMTSLKQHEYEEDSDWVKDVEVTVVDAESEGWPDRENQGYLGFSVSAEWKPLPREQGMLHVLVTVCVNEGQQKRLDKIEFRYVKEQSVPPVFNSNDLRRLIPLEDGEIYNRDKYWAGLSAMKRAYNERGFIDFNVMQTMQLDDVNQTVSLVMDLTEGPQYRWGNVQVIGLDPNVETILRSRMTVGSPASPKLIRDFYQEYESLLPVGASPETVKWQSDAKRAIVDLTFDFSTPPSPPVHNKGLCQ